MEVITQEKLGIIKDILRVMEGPFRAQPLVGNVIHVPKKNRIFLMVSGEDKNGDTVAEKPVIITFTSEGKIRIEKNDTDLDVRTELMKRGVSEEDIVRQ
jgi:hypothetical protein